MIFFRVFFADETCSFHSSYPVSFVGQIFVGFLEKQRVVVQFVFSYEKLVYLLKITRCPFCKTSNYAVEYRGMRSKEEKGMEQVVRYALICVSFLNSFVLFHFFGLVVGGSCTYSCFSYMQEEQRVIEAKIRMQRQELQDEEERMQRRQDIGSSSRTMIAGEVGYTDVSSSSLTGLSSKQPYFHVIAFIY